VTLSSSFKPGTSLAFCISLEFRIKPGGGGGSAPFACAESVKLAPSPMVCLLANSFVPARGDGCKGRGGGGGGNNV
jgi:hypothetical protein